jgi:transposase
MTDTLSQPLPAALDLQQLPNDPPTLKGLVVELAQALHDEQQQAIRLREQLERLLRRLYGRRSERLDSSQLTLFAQDQNLPVPALVADTATADPSGKRRRTPHGRQRLPEHVPRQDIRYELPQAERACPCCGQVRVALGEEVSEQLEYVPASLIVRRHVRVTYVCHQCEHQRQHPGATTSPREPQSSATAGTAEHTPATASGALSEVTTPLAASQPLGDNTVTKPMEAVPESMTVGAEAANSAPLLVPPTADALSETPVATTTPVVVAVATTATANTQQEARPALVGVAAIPSPPLVLDHAPLRSTFVTAPMPAQPIPKCLAGPGLLAQVIVSKFADHVPLYRQEAILLREGVWLSRSTLCDWLAGCAVALQPLFALMWQRVFQSQQLHTDDTPVCVQRQQTKGHLWVYVGDVLQPYTVYDFTLGRRQERPLACLADFKGYLHADAYNGYDQAFAKGCVEVGCWAHARRYFYEARTTDAVRACWVLGCIRQLYVLEAAAKYAAQAGQLSVADFHEVRLQLREREAAPLLNKLGDYLERERKLVLPRSPIGEAFTYMHNQWSALGRYAAHGFLDIDNNVAEQALRAVALGRKNWLFVGSEEGGRTAATLYSMVQTCKRHGLDPWFYLREVLTILPTLSESARSTELPKLLPDQWAQSQRQSHSGGAPPSGS